MKKLFTAFSLLLFILLPVCSFSQPPCMPTDQGSYSEHRMITTFPPLTTDMPLDVLIGYIACDSICRNIDKEIIEDFIERQTFNDTLQYIMKYWYQMADYNPIKFYLYYAYVPNEYKFYLSNIIRPLLKTIHKNSQNPFLDYAIMNSTIIVQASITDTLRINLQRTFGCREKVVVTCSIIDTIKGRFIPSCQTTFNTMKKNDIESKLLNPNFPTNCFQFDYCLNWERNNGTDILSNHGLYLQDSLGIPWIKAGKEYILFLAPRVICANDSIAYLSIMPHTPESYTFAMYPIENGFVLDTKNECGFGTQVHIDAFKSALRTRIYQITHYGN